MRGTQTDQSFIRTNSNWKNFAMSNCPWIEISLSKMRPHLRKQFYAIISKLRMNIDFTMWNIASQIVLGQYFFSFRVRLIDVMLLVYDLLLLSLLLLTFIRVDDILIILIESVIWFIDFWCKSMISANSFSYFLILIRVFLIPNNEDQIKTR